MFRHLHSNEKYVFHVARTLFSFLVIGGNASVQEAWKSEVKDDRKKRLKKVNTTGWISKQTLQELSLDKSSDSDSVASKSLLKQLSDYEVVAAMILTSELSKVLNPVTVYLQGKSVDYATVNSVISEIKEKVNILRSEES